MRLKKDKCLTRTYNQDTNAIKKLALGSGCGSVGRVVIHYTRYPQFKSRHQQNFIYHLYIRKDENKEKEDGNGPSFE